MPAHPDILVLQGNEACAEGALLAECGFFAGYPITPATEIAEVMAARLPEAGGIFIQMEDELASVNAMIGAAWGGLKPMTATSGPGFCLMQEGIGYACVTQTPGVIVNVMRGGPSTGQPTLSSQQDVYQARYGSHGDYEIIVLAPSSAQECLDLTIRAFNLAERFLTPVVILMDEIVGHTRERVELPALPCIVRRVTPPKNHDYKPYEPEEANGGVPYRADFGEGYAILVDGQLHNVMGDRVGHLSGPSAACVKRIHEKIQRNLREIEDVVCNIPDDTARIVVSYGSVSRCAQRAVKEAQAGGVRAGHVRLRTLFPFPDAFFASLATRFKNAAFIVPEMNTGKICREVQRATLRPVRSLPKAGGEMHTPAEILAAIGGA
ncbi:MAG: 2-oxoacid:acceptor oxidoreductase subunit alpha [Desulfovibrio sp.]|jgi:2-oxoglutarate ferredoxin oxidoreductase subunit alpha|nr:2-oxoacid:acceptor oxidoreductase subunit alpha [Desulfovibrio sp.]